MTDDGTTLAVRNPGFDHPDDTDPVWTPHHPELACAANSVSLLMPHMEPYFVRSIAAVVPRLPDELAAQTRAYLGQEMQHQRHHRQFNRFLTAHYPRLALVERLAARAFAWLERTRSTELNVAFAATSETIAYTAARWAAGRRQLFVEANPMVAALFVWHLAEEVEHKSVAYDVYHSIDGSRRRYAMAMALALPLVAVLVWLGTTAMVVAEGRWWRPITWFRLTGWAVAFAFEALPNLAVSLLPSAHPDQLADPMWYEVWLAELDQGVIPKP